MPVNADRVADTRNTFGLKTMELTIVPLGAISERSPKPNVDCVPTTCCCVVLSEKEEKGVGQRKNPRKKRE